MSTVEFAAKMRNGRDLVVLALSVLYGRKYSNSEWAT